MTQRVQNKRLQSQVGQLKASLKSEGSCAKSKAIRAKAEVISLTSEIASLRKEIGQIRSEKTDLESEMDKLKSANDRISSENEKRCSDLNSEIDDLKTEKDRILSEKDELVSEKDELVSTIEELVSEKGGLEDLVEEYQNQLQEPPYSDEQIYSLQSKVCELLDENERLTDDLAGFHQSDSDLKMYIDSLDDKFHSEIQRSEDLSSQIMSLESTLKETQEDLSIAERDRK